MIQALFDNGVDINAVNNEGCTALHFAIENFSDRGDEIIDMFLEQPGIDVNQPDKNNQTPFITYLDSHIGTISNSAKKIKAAETIKKMVRDCNADINVLFADGTNLIQKFLRQKHYELIPLCIEKGFNVKPQYLTQKTNKNQINIHTNMKPLHYIIYAFSEFGNPDCAGFSPKTSYVTEKIDDFDKLIKFLLKSGMDINERDELTGVTALHVATHNHNCLMSQMVKVLLQNGANPNLKDHNQMTPLDNVKQYLRNSQKEKMELIHTLKVFHLFQMKGMKKFHFIKDLLRYEKTQGD